MTVCERCLRHSHLIAHLAPRIAGLLDKPRPRPSGLLQLDEEALIERVASPRRADAARTFLARFDPDTALESLVDADVTAICRHATQYPDGLRQLTDPPRVLYCTGSAERLEELLAQPAATVVGTRKPSPYGTEVARELGRGLAAAGVTVISGLALGVDALAHQGALAGKGRAVPCWRAGRTSRIPRGIGSSIAKSGRPGSCFPSCLRGVARFAGAFRRGIGSWPPSARSPLLLRPRTRPGR